MGTKIYSQNTPDFLPQLVCSSNFMADCECGKRAFNSTNDDQVFLDTKVCPPHIIQVFLIARASEGELQTKAKLN